MLKSRKGDGSKHRAVSDIRKPLGLDPLRRSLSSKGMLVVLDNAESISDPPGADARPIDHLVEELSPFPNICLIITLEFVAPLRFCSSMTTSLTIRTLAPNKPSQHAVNDVYCLGRAVRLRPRFFVDNAGLKTRKRRPSALSRLLRNSGLRWVWMNAEISFSVLGEKRKTVLPPGGELLGMLSCLTR